jgi:hypothetical protein
MEQVLDNKPVTPTTEHDTLEALNARIKAAEANPGDGKAHRMASDTVTSTVQEPTPTTPAEGSQPTVVTPPPVPKKEGLDQFKDKDGNVDDGKIRKANEHLERGLREREELLRKNKELLSKFTKTSQELAETKKAVESPPPQPPPAPAGLESDEEFLRRVAELEDKPLALRELIDMRVQALIGPIHGQLQNAAQEADMRSKAAELQELVNAGHSWIIKDGAVDLSRFEETFKERPWLLQSRTPYLDALRFMDVSSGMASAPAQGGTPILGGGSAVPPPSSAPAVTPEQKMKELSQQYRLLLSRGQIQDANKIMQEMDKLNRGY